MPNLAVMNDTVPVPAPDKLPAPIRMTGIGNSRIAIKANAEARSWFDQGLILPHDFWNYESAKAFQQSIRAILAAPCIIGPRSSRNFPQIAQAHKPSAPALS